MIVVGVTGSLASGKSEAARIFKKFGAQIFDADQAAKKVVQKGTPVYKAILKIFGEGFLNKNRELNRKKLAGHVFSHRADLEKLNILIHPGVIFECAKVIHRCRNKKGVLVLDVPLLFESRMQNLADFTLVVSAAREKILTHAGKKGLPEDLAKKILASQWPLKKKERLADFVIRNDGTLADLEKKVSGILAKVKAKD